MRLQGWEWIIILAIVLLLWGAPKLPGLAKSLGESLKIFRKEMKTDKPADGNAKSSGDQSAAKGSGEEGAAASKDKSSDEGK